MSSVGTVESTPISPLEQKVIDRLHEEFGPTLLKQTTYLTVVRFVRGYCNHATEEGEQFQEWSDKVVEMLGAFLKYRVEKDVKSIQDIEEAKVNEFRATWPCGMHGRGKKGHVVYIDRPGQIDPTSLVEKYGIDKIIDFHIRAMEDLCTMKERIYLTNMRKSREELVTSSTEIDAKAQVDMECKNRRYKHIVILDLDGIGMKHCTKSFYDPIQRTIHIDQHYYPETLYMMFIVNAGWLFKTIWSICSPWIDPITKERIIWGTDTIKDHIDEDQLPQFLGGKCQCAGGKCLQVPFNDGREEEPLDEMPKQEETQVENTTEEAQVEETKTAEAGDESSAPVTEETV